MKLLRECSPPALLETQSTQREYFSPASLEFTETSETNSLSDFLRGEIRQNASSAYGEVFFILLLDLFEARITRFNQQMSLSVRQQRPPEGMRFSLSARRQGENGKQTQKEL
jgi:hypothetical protein